MHLELFDKYNAVIFDLDDTLYPEIEYLSKAYRMVAEAVTQDGKTNDISQEEIYNYLITVFIQNGRNNLYQKMCVEFNINRFSIEEFLFCLRTVKLTKDELKVFPEIKLILETLVNKNTKLFIVTNGNIIQQKNKLNGLNIALSIFNEVVFSSSLGKQFEKQNPFYLNKIIQDYSLRADKMIFVGDSEIDKQASNLAGIDFLNLSDIIER